MNSQNNIHSHTYFNLQKPISDIIPKERIKIACMAWFPTDSQPFPISFKIMDDNGEIKSIKDIQINDMEAIRSQGYKYYKYKCKAVLYGIIKEFEIRYYIDSCEWFIIKK